MQTQKAAWLDYESHDDPSGSVNPVLGLGVPGQELPLYCPCWAQQGGEPGASLQRLVSGQCIGGLLSGRL